MWLAAGAGRYTKDALSSIVEIARQVPKKEKPITYRINVTRAETKDFLAGEFACPRRPDRVASQRSVGKRRTLSVGSHCEPARPQ
jgi:hypothetical protein